MIIESIRVPRETDIDVEALLNQQYPLQGGLDASLVDTEDGLTGDRELSDQDRSAQELLDRGSGTAMLLVVGMLLSLGD